MVLDKTSRIQCYFEEISKIPHGSFNESQISAYLENFAKEHQLKYIRDEHNNVIIYKPATKGYEDHDPVILQAHMDMVCEKNNDVDFDFTKDSLNLYIEDGWLHAKGTTLGADDGVGVSYILSILDDPALQHPALECVFTVQEEVGLLGAIALKADYFKAKKMINLDGGGEVVTTTTSAGGRYNYVKREVMINQTDKPAYLLSVTGLLGGHSGGCIDLERGNSIQLAFRVMNALYNAKIDLQIAGINGGLKENAIPRECLITFVSDSQYEDIQTIVNQVYHDIYLELEFSDPDVKIEITPADHVTLAMCPHCTKDVIKMFYLFPNGLIHKSMAMPGLTYASLNLGKVRMEEDYVQCSFCIRSPLESMKDDISNHIKEVAALCGATSWDDNNFPGWNYVENSPLRNKLEEVLKEQGKELQKEATHGGLETGIFKGLLPELDIITYGPVAFGCHTPDEKLDLSSFERSYQNLITLLQRL